MEFILLKKIVLKQSVIAVALTLSSSQLVYAQLAPQEPALQKILITGSNLKRADKEGTSPVDVITAKDIKDSGASTVAELMKLIPSMGSDTNQDQASGSGFAKGVATASLRGLGSSIYGTNATAGVINMVTDQGGGPVRGELSGEGGGLGLFRGLARISGGLKNDRLQYSAGLANLNVNGGVDGVETLCGWGRGAETKP